MCIQQLFSLVYESCVPTHNTFFFLYFVPNYKILEEKYDALLQSPHKKMHVEYQKEQKKPA